MGKPEFTSESLPTTLTPKAYSMPNFSKEEKQLLPSKAIVDDSVSIEGILYLQAIENATPQEVRLLKISQGTFSSLQGFLFERTNKTTENRLKTLETSSLIFR